MLEDDYAKTVGVILTSESQVPYPDFDEVKVRYSWKNLIHGVLISFLTQDKDLLLINLVELSKYGKHVSDFCYERYGNEGGAYKFFTYLMRGEEYFANCELFYKKNPEIPLDINDYYYGTPDTTQDWISVGTLKSICEVLLKENLEKRTTPIDFKSLFIDLLNQHVDTKHVLNCKEAIEKMNKGEIWFATLDDFSKRKDVEVLIKEECRKIPDNQQAKIASRAYDLYVEHLGNPEMKDLLPLVEKRASESTFTRMLKHRNLTLKKAPH